MELPHDDVIIVDFDDRSEADRAVERLREAGVPDTHIIVGDRGDPRVVDEANADPALRSTPHQSGVATNASAMAWGSFWWMVIGGALGLVLGLLFALIPVGGLDFWERAGIYAVIGILGGAGAGFVFGGGEEPWAREGGRPGQAGLSVAVRLGDPTQGQRVEELLTSSGPTARRRIG